MNVTFVVVNYNGSAHTVRCLRSIRAIRREDTDIVETIVVDNASRAADVETIRSAILPGGWERMVVLDVNVGYFGGLNAGLAARRAASDGFAVVGNNDITFAEDFLHALRNAELEPTDQVVAPRIRTLEGRDQNPHVVHRVARSEKLATRLYFTNYHVTRASQVVLSRLRAMRAAPARTDGASSGDAKAGLQRRMHIKRGIGACYVLTPAFFEKHRALDASVFLWGEEALLSNQVESSGGRTLYLPGLRVEHHESASVRTIIGRERYEMVKRSYAIYRKHL